MGIFFVAILFYQQFALSQSDLTGCAFENTFVFGASISAGYGGASNIVRIKNNMPLDSTHHGSNPDPGSELASTLTNNTATVNNVARIIGRGSAVQETERSFYMHPNEKAMKAFVEKAQKAEMSCHRAKSRNHSTESKEKMDCEKYSIYKEVREVSRMMDEATAWVGIDSHYWESIPNVSAPVRRRHPRWSKIDEDRYEKSLKEYHNSLMVRCGIAARNIFDLTRVAKQKGKVLVLGNIPYDKKENVSYLVRQFWQEPYPPCVDMLNKSIEKTCRVKDQCYILDLKKIGADLTDGNGIDFKGKNQKPEDLRFDGLHLSKTGVEFVVEILKKQIATNPPRCTQAAPIADPKTIAK